MAREDSETHPSWGLAMLSRVSGRPRLFQSPFDTAGYIQLTIRRAEKARSPSGAQMLSTDGPDVIRVNFSPTQFAELVTQVGMYPGVPCTIDTIEGKAVPPPPHEMDEMDVVAEDSASGTFAKSEGLIREVVEILTEELARPTIRRTVVADVLGRLGQARALTGADLKYWRQELAEAGRRIRGKIKAEVAATAELVLRNVGLQALADRAHEFAPQLREPNVLVIDGGVKDGE